ncbi:limonene-1,2-epoxide hydrolase family protein [Williamsia soli]|uniref:limonene-1,2-epoxide hydrolase family protein n=1 Tax=Williamsia soli TaxID=364929 RepID=UPI001A9F74F8|nr:limonene-1,2-epoxide hydrolase family protein [Williamsia soli]
MTGPTVQPVPRTIHEDIRVVEHFLQAVEADDFDTIEYLSADELEWLIAGMTTVRGKDRVMKVLRSGEGKFRTELKTHRVTAADGSVLMERTDAWIIGRLRIVLWVYGVFEVRDGKVTLWRDYFDYLALARATARGLVGLVFPFVVKKL